MPFVRAVRSWLILCSFFVLYVVRGFDGIFRDVRAWNVCWDFFALCVVSGFGAWDFSRFM